jgi:dTDP-glucose pyrophosphorylase
MLNIVIPMAGAGSRFAAVGYKDPKPLIPVHGTPMIKVVIDNIRPTTPHRFIFICQKSHVEKYKLAEKLNFWAPGCELIELEGLTEGAACTVLTATALINNDDSLMIANSDQYVDCDIDQYLNTLTKNRLDGIIMTMTANDPKWSFAGIDSNGLVSTVVEKEVISDEATVGIYNFKRGADFVAAANTMITKNLRVNGEFYVAPAYNQLISNMHRIGIFNIGIDGAGMHGMGTPSDLDKFLLLPISKRAMGGVDDNN